MRPWMLLVGLVAWVVAAPCDVSLLIEPKDLKQSLDRVRVVDLRSAEAFQKGHIPGAVHCFVRRLDQGEANRDGLPLPLEQAQTLFRELGIDADRMVVAYDNHGGRFAARFFYFAEFLATRTRGSSTAAGQGGSKPAGQWKPKRAPYR